VLAFVVSALVLGLFILIGHGFDSHGVQNFAFVLLGPIQGDTWHPVIGPCVSPWLAKTMPCGLLKENLPADR
jgi:hypothetical protein